MLKVASCPFDVYDDIGGAIARRFPAELHEQLKVASPDVVAALPDHDFALILKLASGATLRKLPVHDADAVKVSWSYWQHTRDALPADVQKLVEAKFAAVAAALDAGKSHKVANVIDTTKHANVESPAPLTEAWGLTLAGRNVFPLHDADFVKQAAARFGFTTETLSPANTYQYAQAIVKRASALGVALDPAHEVFKYAGTEVNRDALGHAIAKRKSACAGVDTALLDELYEAAGCRDLRSDSESAQVARVRELKKASRLKLNAQLCVQMLESFDAYAGLNKVAYRKGVPDPYASVFSKSAAPQGIYVDGVDLARVAPADLAAKFDPDTVQSWAADPAGTYRALPDPLKKLIKTMAAKRLGIPVETAGKKITTQGGGSDVMAELNPVYANGSAQTAGY